MATYMLYMWLYGECVMTDTHTALEVCYVASYMWIVGEFLMTVMWPLTYCLMDRLFFIYSMYIYLS